MSSKHALRDVVNSQAAQTAQNQKLLAGKAALFAAAIAYYVATQL